MARGFAQSLSARDLRDLGAAPRARERLSGVHPDLIGAAVVPGAGTPAGALRARRASRRLDLPAGRRPRPPVGGAAARVLARRARRGARRRPARGAARRRRRRAAADHRRRRDRRRLVVRPARAARARRDRASPPAGPARRSAGAGATPSASSPARSTRSAAPSRALQARIDGLALKDPLTGVLNHRGSTTRCTRRSTPRASATRRSRWSCSTSTTSSSSTTPPGHAAGDEALRIAARVLLGELRPGDVCGRIGGDEFLLALPDSDAWGAERVVERLRSAVARAADRRRRARA